MKSIESPMPAIRFLTTSGWASRNFVVTSRFVVTYFPFGHRSFSSTRILPPPSVDEAGRVRLGHPRAVDLARLERVDRLRVVLRQDLHVTAAGRVGLVALRLQPRAQRDVLGVAELRRRERLALEVRRGDVGLHDEVGAARRGAGHDAHRRAVRLRVRVDRRVRTDERRVERAAEDRLDGRGAGVEDRRSRASRCRRALWRTHRARCRRWPARAWCSRSNRAAT